MSQSGSVKSCTNSPELASMRWKNCSISPAASPLSQFLEVSVVRSQFSVSFEPGLMTDD